MRATANDLRTFSVKAYGFLVSVGNVIALLLLIGCEVARGDAIHRAAAAGDLEQVKLLLKQNPDLVSSQDKNGETPLHWAAEKGHKEVAEFLLANKAEVNAPANNGWTSLHVAAYWGYEDMVELLLLHQANPGAKDLDGLTPLQLAERNGHSAVMARLRQPGDQETASASRTPTGAGHPVEEPAAEQATNHTQKAELEHKFNDLDELRSQVRKMKDEMFVARRLELMKNDNGGKKGPELLMQRNIAPSNNVSARKLPADYDLNVQVDSDGTVRVIPQELAAKQATNEKAKANSASVATPTDVMKSLFGDPVIVKANGFTIKQSALDQVVTGAKANAAAQGQKLPPNFQVSVLNQLITIQLLLQKATDADRANGKADADLQYANLLKKFASPEAFERQLRAVGMTVAELRAKAAEEAVAKAALKRELNITVSDGDGQDYYKQHPADFERPETAHVRHILLMTVDPATRTPLSNSTIAAKRKQAGALLERAKGGEDFAELARQYSEDPGSKENGGELPAFSHGKMVPEFEAAAFRLDKDQLSDVVTTTFGFHIIKGIDKTAGKKMDYAAAAEIKDGLARKKIAALAPDYVKKLRAENDVEIVDPALKAQAESSDGN